MVRNYTLLIDKSGSMSKRGDSIGNLSRWESAQELTENLAEKINAVDPDGFDLITFSGSSKLYANTTPSTVANVFTENEPGGSTNLTGALQLAFKGALGRLAKDATIGETVIVVTDGEPDEKRSVITTLIDASKKITADEQLAVLFIQIGKDASARQYLNALDNDLTAAGAPFDIVDVKDSEEVEELGLTAVLLAAISD